MEAVLKILLMPSLPAPGKIENGQDRYLDALARGMAGRVEYIGMDDPQFARGPEQKWEPGPDAKVAVPRRSLTRLIPRSFRLLMGYMRDAWHLARLMRGCRGQVDVVHVNRVGCEIQPIAARLAGFRRIVTSIHNLPGEAERDNWVCRLVERLSFACGDVHIAVSEATYEAWRDRVGLRKISLNRSSQRARRGCVTIHNGMDPVDLAGFDREAYRRQFCVDPDHTFIIGICARLHRMKGHGVLLEAFSRLLKEQLLSCQVAELLREEPLACAMPPADMSLLSSTTQQLNNPTTKRDSAATQQLNNSTTRLLLLIAGSGPEEASISAKIDQLGIGDHVRILGHRNDAEQFAASLDLNVLPSVELETLGYSVVEAMFHGVPSVVSDVGGMKELIGASGGGTVVPAGNTGALAAAIAKYVLDPTLCRREGDLARAYAIRELTAKQMADRTQKVYHSLSP